MVVGYNRSIIDVARTVTKTLLIDACHTLESSSGFEHRNGVEERLTTIVGRRLCTGQRQKSILVLIANCIVAAGMVGFGPPKLVDREVRPMVRSTAELMQWFEASEQPSITADSFLVYDVDAGAVLYSRNADEALPQASLTKLMTALLTLEDGRLNDIVEISAKTWSAAPPWDCRMASRSACMIFFRGC